MVMRHFFSYILNVDATLFLIRNEFRSEKHNIFIYIAIVNRKESDNA